MKNEYCGKNRAGIALAGILALSAFLNIWNLWNQGYSNSYYAAAVRSMLVNPAAAFFSSFDSAGFITVDKPPVGLWVQAAFAAILGYNNWVLDLPQAIAGVASVALIYIIVSRPFGKPAGLIAAFALAITPIFVATARNQTMDVQLIFVILLAIWAALRAAREGSFPCLAVAMVLVGIGFNIKMIQAFIVVPAVLVVYLFGAAVPFREKVFHILSAVLILLIVSLSWAVVVDFIPADQRPYIGSSGDNTVFGLIFGHNGIERLESTRESGKGGMPGSFPSAGNLTGGPGGMISGQDRGGTRGLLTETGPRNGSSAGSPDAPRYRNIQPGMGDPGLNTTDSIPGSMADYPAGSGLSGQGSPQAFSGRQPGSGGIGGVGTPGILRFYDSDVAGQISWLLPLALIGLMAWLKKPASLSLKGCKDAGLFSEKGRTLAAMALWLFPGLLYFSFTSGFWHTYYLATIAPPLAALAGIGVIGMYDTWRSDGKAGWLFVAAVLITGLLEVRILQYNADFAGPLIPGILAGTVITVILLAILRMTGRNRPGKLPVAILLLALAVLFIAPLVWACTPMGYSGGDNLPAAGPAGGGGSPSQPGGGNGSMDDGSSGELGTYLLAHNTGEPFLAATTGTHSAAGLIIATGRPVMALGGFLGTDQPLTLDEFRDEVRNRTVRYFIASGGGGMGGPGSNSAIVSWVESSCTAVPDLGTGPDSAVQLYDCAAAG